MTVWSVVKHLKHNFLHRSSLSNLVRTATNYGCSEVWGFVSSCCSTKSRSSSYSRSLCIRFTIVGWSTSSMLRHSVKNRSKWNHPFVSLSRQSRSSMATQDIGETINATNVVPGLNPHWNEMIYVDVTEDMNHSEGQKKNWSIDRSIFSFWISLQKWLF